MAAMSQAEAAEALGMSERSFRRWRARWLEGGEAARCDRRIGRPSPRRAPPVARAQWRDILCSQKPGVVGNDNTVPHRGRAQQIPESPLRRHFVKASVRVHEYPDGHLALFHVPPRPRPHGPSINKSGQLTRYEDRPT